MKKQAFNAKLRCFSLLILAAVPTLGCAMAADEGSTAPNGEDQLAVAREALTTVRNSCVCLGIAGGGCGNGAIGAARGEVTTGLSTATVLASYGPDRLDSQSTGWACRPEGRNSCVCLGIAGGGCGNGAIGAARGQVTTGVSTATVIASYGPDRLGSQSTGWKCRLSGI